MANPFDQFDGPVQKPSGNPFDQFDAAPSASPGMAMTSPAVKDESPNSFTRGLRDPLDASAQLLTQILPEGVVKAGDRLNNWLADKTGLVAKLPDGGVDGLIRQQEDEYQAARKASGEEGLDGYRLAGHVVSTLLPGVGATRAAQALGRGVLGQAAASGAVTAALTPVTEGDSFWADKALQAAGGAATGAATQGVLGAAARVISPRASINPDVQTLVNENVRITPFQAMGGGAKTLEEKARSLPILGDAITAAHRRGADDLNMAVLRRGIDQLQAAGAPGNVTRSGSHGLAELRTAAGNAYDNLLPRMMANTSDQQFATNMANLRGMVQALPANEARYFDDILNRELTQRVAPNGMLSGDNLRAAQAALRDASAQFRRSPDAYQRQLGGALQQADQELRGLIERSSPQFARELRLINEAYRVMKTAQRASSSVAAEDGVFTPAQLHNAVKAMDRSKDKRAFAEGTAFLQDLSGAGKRVLAQQYPDSGTAGRMLLGGGALASGMANPAIPIGLTGASAAYIPHIQRLLTGAIAARPQAAQGISNQVRQVAPYLAAPSTVLGKALLEENK